MAGPAIARKVRTVLVSIDPRRNLVASAMWLIVALAATFSIAAAVWVGSIARDNVLQQHIRRLALETDQLSSDLGQALTARLDAVRAIGPIQRATGTLGGPNGLRDLFGEIAGAYPQLDWLAIADPSGLVVASNGELHPGKDVSGDAWFWSGIKAPWLGVIGRFSGLSTPRADNTSELGDLAIPVRDGTSRIVGVIAARVSWQRAAHHPQRLTDESDPRAATEECVLNREGVVLIGPERLRGKFWNGIPTKDKAPLTGPFLDAANAPEFERLPNGRQVLVSRSPLSAGNEITGLGWQVQLSEPNERVYQRADALALRILWVSMCLGAATALLGILGARQLTARLKRLALSVASVGEDETSKIEIPRGADEVARLGEAFAKILGDLQQERSELERRVAVRTREVERLAEESRYAAIVRERLKIARDLHDTLAHSMMAMLSEIRFLRILHARDPAAVTDELARAEKVAHEGLEEARTAITQMRVAAVRETGLGPALASAFERFIDRTGLTGDFTADAEAARFGDDRAETILRMAQEALRNVERHAQSTRVLVRLRSVNHTHLELRIEDNGVGFDPHAVHAGHYGIVGLREQAELIGAELRIDSKPNQGTTLCVSLPLSPIPFHSNS
jgi:signal transduction histidine kinase